MDLSLLIDALILGIVEGLTEFLPISSTGHLILVGELLGFNNEKGKLFEIAIQSGAILAVCWEYRRKIGSVVGSLHCDPAARRFIFNLLVAFIPAAVLGLAFGKAVKAHLFNATVVAGAFIVGGVIIWWAEKREHRIRVQTVEAMTWRDALKVGLVQTLALIPGTSRSGATIIGGLLFGLSRQAATEFSFFLAIPTLCAATVYDVYKHWALLSLNDIPLFGVGFIAAFISAFAAVKGLLRYIGQHDFTVFAYYRLVFGVAVLATAHFGWVQWAAG
ncbi:MAG: undecaprenyl-diphosphate phosphatase [Methylococcaceae bacterium]|nr:MAG: undecaprenyl-diphosphate phosphatase [Methylococcaceae bacterium]